MTQEEILSDKEINIAFGNSNFGETPKREIVAYALLKAICGYENGHTAKCIIKELGLIRKDGNPSKRGRQYLWASFGEKSF